MSEPVTKSGTKSIVWVYFGLERRADGKAVEDGSATCWTCRKRVLAKQGNTSNFLAYLKTSHPSIYVEANSAMDAKGKRPTRDSAPVPTPSQLTLVQLTTASQKYEQKGRKWKEFTNAVTYYIAYKDSLPIYMVEKSGFQRMLNPFDARYEVPGWTYFSRTVIPTLYASVREQVKQELSTVQYFLATTDLWSSIVTKLYMSYTLHFVNEEWKLQTRCLQTQFRPDAQEKIWLKQCFSYVKGNDTEAIRE